MKSKSEDVRFEEAFDAIMRWYRDEDRYPLTPSLAERLNRWKSAREFILTMKPLTDSSVVGFLMQTHQVSEPQAWRDVRDTKRFFASMEKTNKDFDRIMLISNIKDLRTKAEFSGDYKVVAQCNATLAKMGVGEEEAPDANVGKKIELHISFNPKLIGAKEIPNLLEQVEKYIGEAARRELMMEGDEL
ncbi:hypothetical protein [Spirosoma sordidisoli]|uniref:Uncharacterized protein n=1 Tax=Spirosoma sordidisoli TaxID=2502893 RepID=A0A4V1RWC2_9BACT|nr:hypothetical protein [Spirosoma sordidisoli]RYC69758.1 hypothetical protein EQG79_14275 [Spirosoma sordidisoli]